MSTRSARLDRAHVTGARGGLLGEWRERAACLDADPELFFMHGRHGYGHMFLPGCNRVMHVLPSCIRHHDPACLRCEAVRICVHCPVAAECLDDALRTEDRIAKGDIHGIRGGFTPRDRRKILQARKGVA